MVLSFFSTIIKGTNTGAQEKTHTGPLDNPNKKASNAIRNMKGPKGL
jgi:hypothetical protein